MALTIEEKKTIKDLLQLSCEEIEVLLSSKIGYNLRQEYDQLAIQAVAHRKNIPIKVMLTYMSHTKPSIFGGEVAALYFEMIRDHILSLIEKEKDLLKTLICVKFDYCKRNNLGDFNSEEFTLACSIVDSLSSYLTDFPFPINLFTVYCLRTQLFDKLCDC